PELLKVDSGCDAFLSNHVANRASRLQGRAFLASTGKALGSKEVETIRGAIVDRNLPGHLAPVFGAVMRALGVEPDVAGRLFVFGQLRTWISAAVRLNIVGPIEGQRIQFQLAAEAERAAGRFGDIPLDDVSQTAPLLDLWQGTQDRLYSRLFQS